MSATILELVVDGDGGWTKLFTDGTREDGDDPLVDSGKAGWRKGRQDGINGVMLTDNTTKNRVLLQTDDGLPGKFWQSDDFEVVFGQTKPVRVKRRIQMKVGPKAWKTVEIDIKTGNISEYIARHKI